MKVVGEFTYLSFLDFCASHNYWFEPFHLCDCCHFFSEQTKEVSLYTIIYSDLRKKYVGRSY